MSISTIASGVWRPGASSNSDVSTPSCSRRVWSQRPHSSSPAPPASITLAPAREAATATFATAPPKRGTKASASSRLETARSQMRSTSASPRQSVRADVVGAAAVTAPHVILAAACASRSRRSLSIKRPPFSARRRPAAPRRCTCTACPPARRTGSASSSRLVASRRTCSASDAQRRAVIWTTRSRARLISLSVCSASSLWIA